MKTACVCALAFVFVFAGCGKKEETGRLTIMLTDAPAAYQAVWVDIQRVDIHLVSGKSGGEWVQLPTVSGIYDLLQLQNGIDTTLVDVSNLPAGKITQMRLILGSNNSIDVGGTSVFMDVPSGSETGIKIVGKMELGPNQELKVVLDFDAAASVVEEGQGAYHLKPVVKVL